MAKKKCPPCATVRAKRAARKKQTPLELFAAKWRRAYVLECIQNADRHAICVEAYQCAKAYRKKIAWATKKVKGPVKASALNPACDPIRVAISTVQAQLVTERAAVALSENALVILQGWLAMCEMGM